MKVCSIRLRQDGNLFRVESFTNTVELSVGMMVPKDKVAEWCSMKRVNVAVIGAVQEAEESPELEGLSMGDVQRVDALQLAAQAMKDTGPGNNPF
jgi:hypothetical protein